MTSSAYRRALKATGYFTEKGRGAPGLSTLNDSRDTRLRPLLNNDRVGLNADAVFYAQGTPTAVFKDAGKAMPDEKQIDKWHEAAWNVGLAPLLWIVTPTDIRLYDCFASPTKIAGSSSSLGVFSLDDDEKLASLNSMCGRLATETGAFWSSVIGEKIDRRYRVDQELLNEIGALEEKLAELPPANPNQDQRIVAGAVAARDFAQRLIGRCIFTWYLLDREIAQPFLPRNLKCDLAKMFSDESNAFALFDWLRKTFNGDLFPMDDPGAERQRLGPSHLSLMCDFIEGRSLTRGGAGQGRLFKFRFDAIPVDLISSIYQQFARSSDVDTAKSQGLHYTPVELVHMTLDPVFEDLSPTARVIDPTCGSGAFLVESFRRLVWKSCGDKAPSRQLVREILYTRLFGIDINRSALGIAAFSLYLAALEFETGPITDVSDLKFDRLIGTTLFEADATGKTLPDAIVKNQFDAVVGNPPWTFDGSLKRPPRVKGRKSTVRPRRSPDQEFLKTASNLSGETGRIGMIMKSTPFFSRDDHAISARNHLFSSLSPVALVNLSALRKENLFPDTSGPAMLFFARCALIGDADQMMVGSAPWTSDFKRNGIVNIGTGDIRSVPLSRVLEESTVLKAATLGSVRDSWLIERLQLEFKTFDDVLNSLGLYPKKARGQGYKVIGPPSPFPKSYFRKKDLKTKDYQALRLNDLLLPRFNHKTLHRPREGAIFEGPLLICPKGQLSRSLELGRYSAAVQERGLLYNESFYGISFKQCDGDYAFLYSGILNSCLTSFQLAFAGGVWGLERPTVGPNDIRALRMPHPDRLTKKSINRVVKAEAILSKGQNVPRQPSLLGDTFELIPAPTDSDALLRLDQAVAELYGLDADEFVLVRESVERARMMIYETYGHRKNSVLPPNLDDLKEYSQAVIQVVNRYLRAKEERHLEAVIYEMPVLRSSWNQGQGGLSAVRFSMVPGSPTKVGKVRYGEEDELKRVHGALAGSDDGLLPPYLNERRYLRFYFENDLIIVKPSERRAWTGVAGLNDGDVILADHWLGARNAVRA